MTNSPDIAAPVLSPDELADLLAQSGADKVQALDARRLGRVTRQLQAARDQAKAADDQPQVKEIVAALRRLKAETTRREGGEAAPEKPAATKAGAASGKDAKDKAPPAKAAPVKAPPVKAPKARPATKDELPPLPKGVEPLAPGEASRSNLPPVRPSAPDNAAPDNADSTDNPRKAEKKAERQRAKEAEKAEKKRLREAEKADRKAARQAERKAARQAEKAAAKG